jgi:hypothetical protein
MNEWITENWMAILLAAAGIGGSIFAAWKWGKRQGKLVFTATATPILAIRDIYAQHGLEGKVVLSVGGTPLDDPHVLRLRLENVGHHDISSDHFDSGKPIAICLGATQFTANMRARLGSHQDKVHSFRMQISMSSGPDGQKQDSISWVDVHPHLIKRRGFWETEILMSGEPNITLTDSIIDTDISVAEGTQATVRPRFS